MPPKKTPDIEFHPDAWERFERATKIVVKSRPKHRTRKKRKKAGLKRR